MASDKDAEATMVDLTAVERNATAGRSPTQRSRATNGKTMFADGGDMRGPWARRLRDLVDLHIADLGGIEAASVSERSIVRRAAVLTVELERLEARFSVSEADSADLDLYQRTAGNLRRLLEALGLERRARDVTPTLAQYLASKAAVAQDSLSPAVPTSTTTDAGERTSGRAKPNGEP